MSDNLATIERRLDELERTVADLRRRIPDAVGESAAERRSQVHICQTDPETMRAILDRVRKEMGIEGEPLPAEEVQRLMLEEGWDPPGNEFSRGIVEMREE
jgi:hypothetical protein